MKILKKMAAAAAVITFLMGLTVMPAAAKEPYDYTITLHAGNKGTVSGRDSVRFTASYDNIISFDGRSWSLMDPTLAASNSASSVKKYVGDGSNYTVKYNY